MSDAGDVPAMEGWKGVCGMEIGANSRGSDRKEAHTSAFFKDLQGEVDGWVSSTFLLVEVNKRYIINMWDMVKSRWSYLVRETIFLSTGCADPRTSHTREAREVRQYTSLAMPKVSEGSQLNNALLYMRYES